MTWQLWTGSSGNIGTLDYQSNWENLVNAIILQAFKDYRWAVRKLRRDPDSLGARWMMADVERFCMSSWLTMLSDIDGEWLLIKIKEVASDIHYNQIKW